MASDKVSAAADRALEGKVRQLVEAHGGGITVSVSDDGDAHISFKGRCASCPSAPVTMGSLVRPALLAVKGVKSVSRDSSVSKYAEARIAKMFNLEVPGE
jgi:Fe-S cluster biogenesis protein NfuA